MTTAEFLSKLDRVRPTSGGFSARCPHHDDAVASLSVSVGEGGRTLVTCFAGCPTEAIVGSMGLSLKDLFVTDNKPFVPRRIVATYEYMALDGVPLRKNRLEPDKKFTWQHYRGSEWVLGDGKHSAGLYRATTFTGPIVWVVEGEKDADRAVSIGLMATTSPHGAAGDWADAYTVQLSHAGVTKAVIIPDNDVAGRKHAHKVASALHAAGLACRVVTLPGVPEKGDLSDYLDAGHTKADLLELVKAAPAWVPCDAPQENQLDDATPPIGNTGPALQHASEVMTAVLASLDAGPPRVVATPFGALNRIVDGGFRAGEFVFLGARPSVGKTALALEIARYAAKTTPVLVVSREMVNEALGRRLIAQDGRVSASDLRCHRLQQDDYARVSRAMEHISSLDLWMTDAALSLTDIEELSERPPDPVSAWGLIVVDYLQLIRAPKGIQDRRMQVEAVSQGLKAIAVARKCPLLCLAALRRSQPGPIPRPTMSDLKESSGLEHDADIIMLMHREDPPEGPRNTVIEINVAKNRDGDTGTRELVFTAACVSFAEREY